MVCQNNLTDCRLPPQTSALPLALDTIRQKCSSLQEFHLTSCRVSFCKFPVLFISRLFQLRQRQSNKTLSYPLTRVRFKLGVFFGLFTDRNYILDVLKEIEVCLCLFFYRYRSIEVHSR